MSEKDVMEPILSPLTESSGLVDLWQEGQYMEISIQLISRVSGAIRSKTDQRLTQSFGISYTQAKVIASLSVQQRLLPAALAERLGCDAGVMSRMISRLVAKDLVEKRPHDTDRRCMWVTLTERGHVVASGIETVVQEAELELCCVLRDEERRYLCLMLKRMLANGDQTKAYRRGRV